jgi:C-terminal processing protease CtpA/Prc
MLGLINPGDSIVGLDDQDTRSMTAASLTRLMAKKSSQKERKITLLTSETYY